MLLNFIILAAVIGMAYWWSVQGFFSAFLHLMCVVLAGALALAVWEPVARLVLPFMYANGAWGVALMGPFLIFLLIARQLTDRLVRDDVRVSPAVDYAAGGVCGVLAACLAAGITIISVGFLPLAPDILGYEPLVVGVDGKIVPNSGRTLWIPVDTKTASFFTYLSGGTFYPWTATPLATYQPDLARQATLYRMGYDQNASMVAMPGSVTADTCLDTETPVNYLDENVTAALQKASGGDTRVGEHRLVGVSTTWKSEPKGTYDLDGFLRVFPNQVRLVSIADPDHPELPDAELEAPLAFSVEDAETHAHLFTPITDARTFCYRTAQTNKIAWIFLMPAGRHPQFLLVRHTRLDLGEYKKDDRLAMKDLVGSFNAPAVAESADKASGGGGGEAKPGENSSDVGLRQGRHAGTAAMNIVLGGQLPQTVSQNRAANFAHDDKHGIISGEGTIPRSETGVSRELALDHIVVSGAREAVRVQVARDQAESLLGAAFSAAASLAPVYLEEKNGDQYKVIAYALYHDTDGSTDVWVDLDNPLESARKIPVRDMQSKDQLYLYFAVPKGSHIVAFHVGQGTKQEVDLTVPK